MRRRLGCLTLPGVAAVLFTLSAVIVALALTGGKPFSPGRLSAQTGQERLGGVGSHAEIGGRCSACHAAPWGGPAMAQRCLACHTGIELQLSDASSLHGALAAANAIACRACHPEHRGLTASLTQVDVATFPHQATGFSLEGHLKAAPGAALDCADCHGPDLSSFDSATCSTCHSDLAPAFMQAHQVDFGPSCLACHDGVDRYGRAFDHDQTAFRLDGRHGALPCGECHAGTRSAAELQGTPQDCFACHQDDDAHQGQFGQDCAGCHTPADWQQATFDHGQTRFPLMGRHLGLTCVQCHAGGLFKGTPTDCVGCHPEPEYHAGLFGLDCGECHTVDGWAPAEYNRPHPFPRDHGEGGASPCRTCHPEQLQTYTCYNCHEHQPAEIEREHRDEGISAFEDCIRCHPTGQKEEGGEDGD